MAKDLLTINATLRSAVQTRQCHSCRTAMDLSSRQNGVMGPTLWGEQLETLEIDDDVTMLSGRSRYATAFLYNMHRINTIASDAPILTG